MSEDRASFSSHYTYLGGTDQVNEPADAYGVHSRIQLIRRGLPLHSLNFLLKASKLTQQELAAILQISARTMQRYDSHQMLPPVVSEKLLLLNDLYEKGDDVLGGGPQNITNWLRSPIAALGNQRPLDYLDTYEGMHEVMNVLGRIEWGIAS